MSYTLSTACAYVLTSPGFLFFSSVITEHGKTTPTIDQPPLFLEEPFDLGKHTVAYQARYVKALFAKVT